MQVTINAAKLQICVPGAYGAGKASEGARNSYIDYIDIKIQTWPTITILLVTCQIWY